MILYATTGQFELGGKHAILVTIWSNASLNELINY